jgi:hypothetical protein
MKLTAAMLVVACCVLALPADAQQRDRGDRGGGGRDRNVTVNKYYGGGGRSYGGRQYYRERRPGYTYHPGYGWYNPSAVIGGAVGSWLWRQWNQPEAAPEPEPVRGMEWCMNRYKSYDPYTKTYLGYDGLRHGCP